MIPACLQQLTLEVLASRLIHLVCHTAPAFANVPEITKQSSSQGGTSASVLLAAFFLLMLSSPAIGLRESFIIGLGFSTLAFIRLHPDSAAHPHDIAPVTGSIAFLEVKLSPQPELSLLPIAYRKLFPSGLRKPSHLENPPAGCYDGNREIPSAGLKPARIRSQHRCFFSIAHFRLRQNPIVQSRCQSGSHLNRVRRRIGESCPRLAWHFFHRFQDQRVHFLVRSV